MCFIVYNTSLLFKPLWHLHIEPAYSIACCQVLCRPQSCSHSLIIPATLAVPSSPFTSYLLHPSYLFFSLTLSLSLYLSISFFYFLSLSPLSGFTTISISLFRKLIRDEVNAISALSPAGARATSGRSTVLGPWYC